MEQLIDIEKTDKDVSVMKNNDATKDHRNSQ